jgi:CheY-like chemotaxis protein/HPt (histidine-containing phosphotransfer) domain-containing protein
VCCSDSFDALADIERAASRGNPYDIVFIDQMMPGLAGEALAQRIRGLPQIPDLKLVLISSAGHHNIGGRANESLDVILDKPIRQRDLFSCLSVLYEGRATSHEPDASQITPASKKISPSPPRNVERKLRIILAEDNAINQKFATALLTKAGHEITIAENGLKALEAVRRDNYDLILMDIQMPDMDGIQATRAIRALPSPKCDIPIIALTAHALSGAKEEYIAAGMNDYLSKPIDPSALFTKINKAADRSWISTNSQTTPDEASDPPDDSGTGIIDPAAVATLRSAMTRAEIRDFVETYLRESDQRIIRLVNFSNADDLAAIVREAHDLVSTSGSVGAFLVSNCARSLEKLGRAGDSNAIQREIDELRGAYNAAALTLKSWIDAESHFD